MVSRRIQSRHAGFPAPPVFVCHAGGDRCRVAAFGRDTPARGFGRASLVVCRRVIFNLFGCSLGEPSTESSCGVGATEDETSTRAVGMRLSRSDQVARGEAEPRRGLKRPRRADSVETLRIAYSRSAFSIPAQSNRHQAPNYLVAFATIRDPPGWAARVFGGV